MKKLISMLMIIIIMISTTSCRGTKKELDHLSVVLAIGYDLTPQNKYLLTFQVLNTKKQTPARKDEITKQQIPSDVLFYSAEGNTPRDAINKLSTELGRSLFIGHGKYIVVSEDIAKYGLTFFTDAILRGYESRPSNLLLITKGKAEDIVKALTQSDTIPAAAVEAIQEQQSRYGYSPAVSRIEFANFLSSKTTAPIIGEIELSKSKDDQDDVFKMAGTAVFKKDKLIGYLNPVETQGMQWIRDKVKETSITTTLYEDGFITFDILKSKSKVTASLVNDTITTYVNIKTQGNIFEMSDSIDVIKNPGAMPELGKLNSASIENIIKSALNKTQKELKADVFGFGELIHRTYPKYWKTIEDDWDNIFPDLDVKVDVESSIKRPGIINKPIQ